MPIAPLALAALLWAQAGGGAKAGQSSPDLELRIGADIVTDRGGRVTAWDNDVTTIDSYIYVSHEYLRTRHVEDPARDDRGGRLARERTCPRIDDGHAESRHRMAARVGSRRAFAASRDGYVDTHTPARRTRRARQHRAGGPAGRVHVAGDPIDGERAARRAAARRGARRQLGRDHERRARRRRWRPDHRRVFGIGRRRRARRTRGRRDWRRVQRRGTAGGRRRRRAERLGLRSRGARLRGGRRSLAARSNPGGQR